MDENRNSNHRWDTDPWDIPGAGKQRRRRPAGLAVFLVCLTLIIIGTVASVLFYQVRWTATPEPWPEDPWSVIVPDEDKDEGEKEVPPRAPVGTGVTMQVRSAQGKRALTYQQLYQQCVNGVVSVRVESADGAYLGTGIIMTEDGYIITNCHVVDDCHSVSVTLEDGRELDALLVGKDAQSDLAVLKVQTQGLTVLEFGDADELLVGDEVLAIGNPMGEYLRGTLTNGIISAINRDITMNGYSMSLLQTTAALNNGNSGGPLLNVYGQVVGINNMKIMSDYSTVEGLGFAIPTSVAKDVVDQLIEQGYVKRAVLGITCYAITPDDWDAEDFEGGLKVREINPGSKAYDTQLQEGDVIVAANGVPIRTMSDMAAVKEGLGVGDVIDMLVCREDGQRLTISVPLCDQRDLQ